MYNIKITEFQVIIYGLKYLGENILMSAVDFEMHFLIRWIERGIDT